MKIAEIQKISDDTLYKLKRGSVWGLPNNPSERGMKADDIRKAFYQSLLNGSDSLIEEHNKLVDSLNPIFVQIEDAVNAIDSLCGEKDEAGNYETLSTAARTLVGAINELDALLRTRSEEGEFEALAAYGQDRVGYGKNTLIGMVNAILEWANDTLPNDLKRYTERKDFEKHANASALKELSEEDPHHTKQAISIAKNEILSSHISPIQAKISAQAQLINQTAAKVNINRQDIFTVNTNVIKNRNRISAVESQLSGVTRSFALSDFASFISFMHGESTITDGDSTVGVWNLITGDNVLLIEHNTADFWYQQTSDVSGAEKYTYNGVEYTLIAKDADGNAIGLMHVAESDYNVIEGQVVSAQQSANEAKAAAEETDADRVAIQTLVNSIFYIQKAPTLEHINDAVMLPTPTLAMLPDGMV